MSEFIPCPICGTADYIIMDRSSECVGDSVLMNMNICCRECSTGTHIQFSSHTPDDLVRELAADRWNEMVRKESHSKVAKE